MLQRTLDSRNPRPRRPTATAARRQGRARFAGGSLLAAGCHGRLCCKGTAPLAHFELNMRRASGNGFDSHPAPENSPEGCFQGLFLFSGRQSPDFHSRFVQPHMKSQARGNFFISPDDKYNTNAFGQSICKLLYSHHGWYCYGDTEILVSCRPFFAYARGAHRR